MKDTTTAEELMAEWLGKLNGMTPCQLAEFLLQPGLKSMEFSIACGMLARRLGDIGLWDLAERITEAAFKRDAKQLVWALIDAWDEMGCPGKIHPSMRMLRTRSVRMASAEASGGGDGETSGSVS